jgi:hypothetical protein
LFVFTILVFIFISNIEKNQLLSYNNEMSSILIFCSLLSFGLGFIQFFFPEFLEDVENYFDQLLNLTDNPPVNFRKIVGFLLMIIGVILFSITIIYDLDSLL